MDLDKLQEEVEFDNNLLITMFKHILHLQQQFDEAEYDSSMRDGIEEHIPPRQIVVVNVKYV